jgi:hypothetical protein
MEAIDNWDTMIALTIIFAIKLVAVWQSKVGQLPSTCNFFYICVIAEETPQ